MQISLSFIRILFLALCILFSTSYALSNASGENTPFYLAAGVVAGLIVWGIMVGLDKAFKHFNIRTFNLATIGLFFGYLLGEAVMLVFSHIIDLSGSEYASQALPMTRIVVFLFTTYLGMIMTVRASDEVTLSIPFIQFKQHLQKKKDLLIDSSVLLDPRIIDLAVSGLLDHHLVLPTFLVREFNEVSESVDEPLRVRARRCLDVIKKLEGMTSLELRHVETDFIEIKDTMTKLIKIARSIDANILTADATRLQQPSIEGIRLINIHVLSTALKPMAQNGEYITIKIQRYGKEPRQGIGYMDDGTMVVINGGAEFIGETIRAQVLSAKHTASGRMIFCNALEDNTLSDSSLAGIGSDIENSAKNYFAL